MSFAFWWTEWNRQERFDQIPQRIWKQRGGHTRSRYVADEDQASEVGYTLDEVLDQHSEFRRSAFCVLSSEF